MATQNSVQTPTEVLMTEVNDAANGVRAMANDAKSAVGGTADKLLRQRTTSLKRSAISR